MCMRSAAAGDRLAAAGTSLLTVRPIPADRHLRNGNEKKVSWDQDKDSIRFLLQVSTLKLVFPEGYKQISAASKLMIICAERLHES